MTYYDEIAEGYDELHEKEQFEKLKLILSEVSVNKDELLLDVGCGTGISTRFWSCTAIGVDPSIKLLEKAEGAHFVQAKAEALPFKDNTFDIVISITAIHNFNDVEKGLQEIKRVGKNKFVLTVLKKSPNSSYIGKRIMDHFMVRKIKKHEHDLIFIV